MSQTQILDLVTLVPAIPLDRVRTYVELPAFSISGILWTGASVIVQQYNFSADSNFYLDELPDKPAGVNYGLCIRYRVGGTVYRYKLWDDALFILPAVNLYDGEVIKKNFVLEVWSFQDAIIATQDDAIQMITSRRIVPSSLRSMDDVSLATGAEVDYAELLSAASSWASAPPTVTSTWLKADAGVTTVAGEITSWVSQGSVARTFTPTVTGPSFIAADPEIFNLPCANFDDVGKNIKSTAGSPYSFAHLFMLVKQTGWLAAGKIISHTSIDLSQQDVSPEIRATMGASTIDNANSVLDGWFIVEAYWDGALLHLNVYDFLGNEYDASVARILISTGTTLSLGSVAGATASMKIAEFMSWQFALSDANRAIALSYLKGRVGVALAPLTFNSSSAWLTN